MHELRLGEHGGCEEGGCGQCASQQRGPSSCEDFGSAMGLMTGACVQFEVLCPRSGPRLAQLGSCARRRRGLSRRMMSAVLSWLVSLSAAVWWTAGCTLCPPVSIISHPFRVVRSPLSLPVGVRNDVVAYADVRLYFCRPCAAASCWLPCCCLLVASASLMTSFDRACGVGGSSILLA